MEQGQHLMKYDGGKMEDADLIARATQGLPKEFDGAIYSLAVDATFSCVKIRLIDAETIVLNRAEGTDAKRKKEEDLLASMTAQFEALKIKLDKSSRNTRFDVTWVKKSPK